MPVPGVPMSRSKINKRENISIIKMNNGIFLKNPISKFKPITSLKNYELQLVIVFLLELLLIFLAIAQRYFWESWVTGAQTSAWRMTYKSLEDNKTVLKVNLGLESTRQEDKLRP